MSQFRLNRKLFGRGAGNFSPTGLSRDELMQRIVSVRPYYDVCVTPTPFCPKPSFTNRVVSLGEEDDVYEVKHIDDRIGDSGFVEEHEVWENILIRTKNPADGGIVRGTNNAVAFFNGDCPIIALVEDDKIAVLHAGFRTQIRENKDEPNIIEVAMKHFDPDNTRAFIGFGIGPCCWVPEYEDKPEVLDPSKSRHPELLALCISRTTDASPFGAGHASIDLYKLAKGLIMETGIPARRILINNQCTCCARAQDERLWFWSHNRFKACKQEVDGRNMAVAWLDADLTSDGFEKL